MTTTATATPPASAGAFTPKLWGILVTLCVVLFLDGLDVSMVGVALPSIGNELHMSTSSLQWLISGYILGYGGLLLLGGRTADLLGRRKVFIIALAVFAAASLIGGLVSSPALLIATRFIKGIAAAFTAPTGLSIITTTFAEGPARNKALSIYTLFGASGYSSGLIFGGLMTGLGWRWTFLLPAPIAIAALVSALAVLPRDKPAEDGGHDILGAILSTAGMLVLVYTVVSAPDAGWGSARTVGGFAAAVALLALFTVTELRVRHPLVRLGILAKPSLAQASIAIIAMAGSYFSFQFLVTMYFQHTLKWSPLALAMALLPAGILVVLSAPFADRLIDRFGTGRLITVAMVSMTIGYALFLSIDPHPVYLTAVLPTVLLLGLGFALGFPSINIQATSGIDDHEQGLAAGVVQTAMQVGAALVLAATTAIISTKGAESSDPATVLDAYRPGLVFVLIIGAIGALAGLTALRKRRVPAPVAVPQPEREPVPAR